MEQQGGESENDFGERLAEEEEEYLIEDIEDFQQNADTDGDQDGDQNGDPDEDPFAENEYESWSALYDGSMNPFSTQEDSHIDDSTQDKEADVETAPEKKKFFFLANYFVKKYTRQKSGVCLNEKTNIPEKVFGDSLAEVQACIWRFIKPHLCREIDVHEADGIKVSWSVKEEPDIRDINNFVHLRDPKRKTVTKMDQLAEGRMLLNWREKVMDVFAFAYSQSVSSVAIWDKVNKCLLQPTETDRAGAPSNVNLDELVQDLKKKNSHLTSHDSGWIQWANWIHASPAHLQAGLMTQLPPADMKSMFWSLPVSEGSRAECLREGLVVAGNIVANLSPGVKAICDKADHLTNMAFDVKVLAEGLKEKLNMCSDMLKGMQTSLQPQESPLSHRVREDVGDMMDMDHA